LYKNRKETVQKEKGETIHKKYINNTKIQKHKIEKMQKNKGKGKAVITGLDRP
jgi:hypothetical protein